MITPDEESKLDEILNNIDNLSEGICDKAKIRTRRHQKSPALGFNMAQINKTRMAFSVLAESSLLESADSEAESEDAA